MSEEVKIPEVPEADKPFYLVMIGTIAFILIGVWAIHEGIWAEAEQFMTALGTLVGMGWGYYFRSKV
jgi:hypothetical protein